MNYVPTSAFIWSLVVFYSADGNSYEIPGSPFKVYAVAGAPYVPNFLCFGKSPLGAVKEGSSHFFVLIRDQNFNPINASSAGLLTSQFSFYAGSSSLPFSSSIVTSGDWDPDFFAVLKSQGIPTPSVYRIDYTAPSSDFQVKLKYGATYASTTPSITTYNSVEVSSTMQTAVLVVTILTMILTISLIVFLIVYGII